MEKPLQKLSVLDRFLFAIPRVMAGKVSIFIYLFLFFYLVIFALVCLLIPALKGLAPSAGTQLILGNYTNVLSALGASIAAGSGVAIHTKVKAIREGHRKLQDSIDELHKKIDQLGDGKKQEPK